MGNAQIRELIEAGVPLDRIGQLTDGTLAYVAPCPAETPSLLELARTPLGEAKPGDVEAITGRVLATHADQDRIKAAKFSSII